MGVCGSKPGAQNADIHVKPFVEVYGSVPVNHIHIDHHIVCVGDLEKIAGSSDSHV